jgi:hypothetical protein
MLSGSPGECQSLDRRAVVDLSVPSPSNCEVQL